MVAMPQAAMTPNIVWTFSKPTARRAADFVAVEVPELEGEVADDAEADPDPVAEAEELAEGLAELVGAAAVPAAITENSWLVA